MAEGDAVEKMATLSSVMEYNKLYDYYLIHVPLISLHGYEEKGMCYFVINFYSISTISIRKYDCILGN